MTETSLLESQGDLANSMVNLVAGMARALVDNPDRVTVEAVADRDSTLLLLRVAASDLGKVIGKQGRTARSIRTILGAASMKAQHRFALDIQQEDGWRKDSTRDQQPEADEED
jgi:predicted RNA-binding protein YlqC (UPF0109 family)